MIAPKDKLIILEYFVKQHRNGVASLFERYGLKQLPIDGKGLYQAMVLQKDNPQFFDELYNVTEGVSSFSNFDMTLTKAAASGTLKQATQKKGFLNTINDVLDVTDRGIGIISKLKGDTGVSTEISVDPLTGLSQSGSKKGLSMNVVLIAGAVLVIVLIVLVLILKKK